MDSADKIIRELGLAPLPMEGGFYFETYRSATPAATERKHCAMTGIYYLLKHESVSTWHKVSSDEIWCYHAGEPAVQLLLFPDGAWEKRVIGPDVLNGERPQSLIPAGVWQAAALRDRTPGSWGLFGAFVAPGFEFSDYTGGSAEELASRWPAAESEMRRLRLVTPEV
jgi:predicted cupin superfamily sugar epimerase